MRLAGCFQGGARKRIWAPDSRAACGGNRVKFPAFAGYFLGDSTLSKVFTGSVDAPMGLVRVPNRDSAYSAAVRENWFQEPNRSPNPGSGGPFLGQLLWRHSRAERGGHASDNQKEKSFVGE